MLIQILCDNPNSWIIPYAIKLKEKIKSAGYEVKLIHLHEDVVSGDILVLLSCEIIFKRLNLNKHNLVVHESALPEGKGWSPLTWQVVEGKDEIQVTLIEASEEVDSGVIYNEYLIKLDGSELINDLRFLQGEATILLVLNFIENYPNNKWKEQIGPSSFYPKRKPEHSQLDINQSIAAQFNLLRVCDNERYPAWFELNDKRYIIKIYRNV